MGDTHQREGRRIGHDPALGAAPARAEPRERAEAVALTPPRTVPADAAARSRAFRDYRPSLRERLTHDPRLRRRALRSLLPLPVVGVALACSLTVRMPPAIDGPEALTAPRSADAAYVRRVLTSSAWHPPRLRRAQPEGGRPLRAPGGGG